MRKLSVVLVLCFLAGSLSSCHYLWPSSQTAPEESKIIHVDEGKIVRDALLQKGGDLLLVPFSPGTSVAASDRQERISLRIVKGISDVLIEKAPSLRVLVADNADEADLIMRGYLLVLEEPKGLKNWILGKDPKRIKVTGKIVKRQTGEVVLYFTHMKETKESKLSLEELAMGLGEDIGQFIESGLEKE